MMMVGLDQRAQIVRAVPGRVAAVALPVVTHPVHGPCIVVTERSLINGHTGEPMSHAGEVVLFGGAVDPGETTSEAALRELH
ncbi:NUDIX domain-containing protein [Actinopolymorpha alba]|uniref:NUDIX domain-containing protein n=1 Tax=Actinopolymorpha alba TaxID=533267 RepID=UPI00037C8734|nr:NUDIX domain-containing protein [Actinopolymorpha alba]